MTETDAEKFLAEYRAMLKTWTMRVTGMEEGDPRTLGKHLEECEPVLAEIALAFPNKAYSVDLLSNARKRTWVGDEDKQTKWPDAR